AAGRVLLAALSRDDIIRFTVEVGEAAFTHVTPPTVNGLLAQIDEVRRRGYAWAFEETIRSVHTVAAPIRVPPSDVAVLSATGPLVSAAAAISASMGYPDPLPVRDLSPGPS